MHRQPEQNNGSTNTIAHGFLSNHCAFRNGIPVLMQEQRNGIPKLTANYSVKLPTARAQLGSDHVDHSLALEAVRSLGADYRHLVLYRVEAYWSGEDAGEYTRVTSVFSRARFRLESETDAAWSGFETLESSAGFLRQGMRIRLRHNLKIRMGIRVGVGPESPNGFYIHAQLTGRWAAPLMRPAS